MKTLKRKKGFTLIELLLGVMAMSIIALTVGSMLVFGWIGWRRINESVAMQRNAMLAMRVIQRGIRNAAAGQVAGIGTQQLNFPNAIDTPFSATTLSEGGYVSLTSFSVTTNSLGGLEVGIQLQTSSGAESKNYTITTYPRNK